MRPQRFQAGEQHEDHGGSLKLPLPRVEEGCGVRRSQGPNPPRAVRPSDASISLLEATGHHRLCTSVLGGTQAGEWLRKDSGRGRGGQMSAAVLFSFCHCKLLSSKGLLSTSPADKRGGGQRHKSPRQKDQAQSCL